MLDCERRHSAIFKLFVGRCCVDYSVNDFERYPIKKFATCAGWPGDAFAAARQIVGVMRLAHQVTAVLGEKLIINPVHRHRYMPAAIDVSVKLTRVVDHEAFLVSPSNRDDEFVRFPRLELGDECDPVADSGSFMPCLRLMIGASSRSRRALLTLPCHRDYNVDRRYGDCPVGTIAQRFRYAEAPLLYFPAVRSI
jgi:hypothetical protein